MARSLACALFLAAALPAAGQPAAINPAPGSNPPPPPDEELTVRPGGVGYIDWARPVNQVRLRADLGDDFRTPTRAEFFYPRSRPLGPGLPDPERAVDFQDYTLYLEKLVAPGWSVFAEGGVRALNPEINEDHTGLSDANVGFKYAFLADECQVWSFQLRTYLPTGAGSRGLGTHHVSLEPAVLGFVWLTEDLGVAAELRYWHPLGGTDFAGDVVRYGLGVRYDVWRSADWRLAPTVEVVGWSVLNGQESRLTPDGRVVVLDSGGTNVVNLKVGARLDLGDQAGLFVGYGRALTGERWYRDVVRVELRWLY
jgi:Putative MetA-pathway of phenol degradation